MCKNGFWLITLIFFQKLTPSPVATHTKSGMPRRSKGSKHSVRIFIFSGRIVFFGVGGMEIEDGKNGEVGDG